MVRKNGKQKIIDYENSIKKSNDLSMAKLSNGLTLNQMQLLAYAIYSTQQNGKTEFHKADFEKKFGLSRYLTEDAREDASKISRLQFSITDLENDYFEYWNVFQGIRYKEGLFTFKWSEDMIPHILDLQEKYVLSDLSITAKFKSSFSWTLYDFLKAHYGYWHKPISKESLMRLFGVEDKQTYIKSTAQLKRGVLDVAINEINKYTELEVSYQEEKKGRAIVGFDLTWSSGEKVASATKTQIRELKRSTSLILNDTDIFINVEDKDSKIRAYEIIREVKDIQIHTNEPICITKEYADTLIVKVNHYFRLLNQLLESDNNPRKELIKYDWLNS